jgi:hypothetical protein
MLDQQLVSDIFNLRDRINEMVREVLQDMSKLPKSDTRSPESLNAAKRLGKRLIKLEELRLKAKELALETTRFQAKDSTE